MGGMALSVRHGKPVSINNLFSVESAANAPPWRCSKGASGPTCSDSHRAPASPETAAPGGNFRALPSPAFRRLRPFFSNALAARRAATKSGGRRARQCHVKQAQFLAQRFPFLSPLRQPVRRLDRIAKGPAA